MAITTTVVGSYPKPPDEGQPFVVRKTLHRLERGEATGHGPRQARRTSSCGRSSREQEAAGIDIVTDGHARWDDILTPFARHIAGFEIGGLLRWFDNNVYYRRPICDGTLEWRGPSSVDAFRVRASVASQPVKAVIPGPVTFARLSVDEHYGTTRSSSWRSGESARPGGIRARGRGRSLSSRSTSRRCSVRPRTWISPSKALETDHG